MGEVNRCRQHIGILGVGWSGSLGARPVSVASANCVQDGVGLTTGKSNAVSATNHIGILGEAMATTETPLLNVAEVEAWMDEDRREFVRLVNERQHWKLTEDEAKKYREDCDRRIEAMLSLSDQPMRVQSDLWIVQRVTSTSAAKLDPKRLVELGVSTNVIQQATTPGKPYAYVLIKQA